MGGVQKEMVEGQKGHKEIWIIDIEDRQNRLGVYLNNKPKKFSEGHYRNSFCLRDFSRVPTYKDIKYLCSLRFFNAYFQTGY